MRADVFPVLTALVLAGSCAAGAEGGADAGFPRWMAPLRDPGYLFEGYAHTSLAVTEDPNVAYEVARSLPEVTFDQLSAAMLGDGEEPVVSSEVRGFEGRRIRTKGFVLGNAASIDQSGFVLHGKTFDDGLDVRRPWPNQQLLVRLAEDAPPFAFTDAPVWVEGVLRLGRYQTSQDGDLTVYLLEDARVQVLPAEGFVGPGPVRGAK